MLVPNTGRSYSKGYQTKIDYNQSATHLHHASDLGIRLPRDFDMAKYKTLDRAGKIEYAKKKVPPEIIWEYQNALGRSITGLFGVKTDSIPGFAGKYKQETELTLQKINPDRNIIGIIRQDGTHISSFSVRTKKLKEIAKNDFWVLKGHNL